jgi:hypothetical protein
MQKITATFVEVAAGILPIVLVLTLLHFTVAPIPGALYQQALLGSGLMLIGLMLFLLGVDIGFAPMGESLGRSLVSRGRLWLILVAGLTLGFVITVLEPDVQVLAAQAADLTPGLSKTRVVLLIAGGVGLFVALALLRIFLRLAVVHLLALGYLLAVGLYFLVPAGTGALAFDAGGVTTGSLTVPFIMALGVGVAGISARTSSSADTFGVLALASLGPILVVLLVGGGLG